MSENKEPQKGRIFNPDPTIKIPPEKIAEALGADRVVPVAAEIARLKAEVSSLQAKLSDAKESANAHRDAQIMAESRIRELEAQRPPEGYAEHLKKTESRLSEALGALNKIAESGPVWERTREHLIAIAEEALSASVSLAALDRREKLEAAYRAHRKEFDHLANCKDCESGMEILCNDWEKIIWEEIGKSDYAYDKALAALSQPQGDRRTSEPL